MKETKIIEVKLNGLYDARFTLEFSQDKDGNEIGILTAPYVQWYFSPDIENGVETRIFEISGKLLECIEKQFFDNNVVTIPIKDYPYPIEMEFVLFQVLPKKIYKQMLNGTYKIADDADKSIYGNMPVKIAKSAKSGKQSEYRITKDPSLDVTMGMLKDILPDYEQTVVQMLNGTYNADDTGKSKRGNKPKKVNKERRSIQ